METRTSRSTHPPTYPRIVVFVLFCYYQPRKTASYRATGRTLESTTMQSSSDELCLLLPRVLSRSRREEECLTSILSGVFFFFYRIARALLSSLWLRLAR